MSNDSDGLPGQEHFGDDFDPESGGPGIAEALARCAREVADFVDAGGWGQSPQMFALVPTAALAAAEPGLLDDLADGAALTPIQQHSLPDANCGEAQQNVPDGLRLVRVESLDNAIDSLRAIGSGEDAPTCS